MMMILALLSGLAVDGTLLAREHPFDDLMNCWADQWPGRVPTADVATREQIAKAVVLTRKNCRSQIQRYRTVVRDELSARDGLKGRRLENAASGRVDKEIREMFDEFWSRD